MTDSLQDSARWLIVADDRTGAADSAIPFANRGLPTTVGWHVETAPDTTIYSHDADCRHLPPEQAAQTFRDAVQRLLPTRAHFFKKIDSTLRGQFASETAATLDLFRQTHSHPFAILAPAYPAQGRTTKNAHVHLHGKPLEQNPLWQRDHTYPNANLADILTSANIPTEKIPLEKIRQGPAALREHFAKIQSQKIPIAICDAIEQSDLDTIASASGIGVPPMQHGQDAPATFFIGTAGLAHALAAQIPQRPLPPLPQIPDKRPTLIVVGSFAEPSRAAAAVLAKSPSVTTFQIPIDSLLTQTTTPTTKILEALQKSRDTLILLTADRIPDPSLHPQIAHTHATLHAPPAPHISSLIATGGQTAAAILDAFHITALTLLQEIAPAIPLALSRGKIQIPVVTKSGAFGNDQSLSEILRRLRELRQIRCHP